MSLRHPIWLAGFRPFFILAMISAVILPLTWVWVFAGEVTLWFAPLSAVQWHAHEMLFGFGWAVLGGFLLTASKNCVNVRGIHGATLAVAVGLWMLERMAMFFYGSLPELLRGFVVNACVIYVVVYLQWTLIRYRKQDSFRDNLIFVVALPFLLVAKNLILGSDFVLGWTMAIGLFRLAFVVMFERTLTQFMKNAMQVHLFRHPFLDHSVKALALAAVFAGFMPPLLAASLLGLSGLLLFVRFLLWKPQLGFRNFGIGLSYFGYLGLCVHFVLESLRVVGILNPVGSLTTHVFTFLCMGIVIPAMIIRISQGHTGRKLLFALSDRIAIAVMLLAAAFRLIATQVWPAQYSLWIVLAAIGWAASFSLFGWRLIPFLVQPRLDGRDH